MIGRKLTIPLGDGAAVATVGRTGVIRCSLRTRDPREAKAREAEALAYLERLFAAEADSRPMALTRSQAVALSRIIYAGWAEPARERTIAVEMVPDPSNSTGYRAVRVEPEDDDGSEEAGAFSALAAGLEVAHGDPAALERLLGPIIDRELPKHLAAPITSAARTMLLEEFRAALLHAASLRVRRAGGVGEDGRRELPDHSPDPHANRYPPLTASDHGSPSQEAPTLTGLVEGWWREQQKAGLKPATYTNYGGAFRALVRFLKHDDASRVTVHDVLAFKDHRLEVVSARTVKDNDLAALKSVFEWSVTNRKIPANPAKGVTIKGARRSSSGKMRRGFTDAEAVAILRASRSAVQGIGERDKVWLARLWVPWVMAYTGARVGEVCQLRKEDVREYSEGSWVIHITPDAGTVKTVTSERSVPLHPHLVELGFPSMVQAAKRGHLFATPNAKTKDARASTKDLANKVRKFVRGVVSAKDVDPSHGWRHRFKSEGRKADIGESYLDALCGHEQATVGRAYGEYPLEVLHREIVKFPRIELGVLAPQRPGMSHTGRTIVVARKNRAVPLGGGAAVSEGRSIPSGKRGSGVPDTPFFRGQR